MIFHEAVQPSFATASGTTAATSARCPSSSIRCTPRRAVRPGAAASRCRRPSPHTLTARLAHLVKRAVCHIGAAGIVGLQDGAVCPLISNLDWRRISASARTVGADASTVEASGRAVTAAASRQGEMSVEAVLSLTGSETTPAAMSDDFHHGRDAAGRHKLVGRIQRCRPACPGLMIDVWSESGADHEVIDGRCPLRRVCRGEEGPQTVGNANQLPLSESACFG